mmetsp:Transcript_65849/g.176443  ORF Transcript_65849/g.176443 Transcript_65849/m.176443 type:complete len:229 (-) Transcript_65849:543-1229(-)
MATGTPRMVKCSSFLRRSGEYSPHFLLRKLKLSSISGKSHSDSQHPRISSRSSRSSRKPKKAALRRVTLFTKLPLWTDRGPWLSSLKTRWTSTCEMLRAGHLLTLPSLAAARRSSRRPERAAGLRSCWRRPTARQKGSGSSLRTVRMFMQPMTSAKQPFTWLRPKGRCHASSSSSNMELMSRRWTRKATAPSICSRRGRRRGAPNCSSNSARPGPSCAASGAISKIRL